MALRISIAIACLAGVFAAPASAAVAPIGAAPTNQDPRCSHPRACTEPIVVASSDQTPRPVEMVGYLLHSSLCVGLDVDALQQGAICSVQRPRTNAIESLGQVVGNDPGAPEFTATYGALRNDVASLDVTYRRNDSTHAALPVIAFINGDLQERLSQSEPYEGFVVLTQGCVPIRDFTFVARDKAGNVLQRVHSLGPPQPEAKPGCGIATAPGPPATPAPVGGSPTQDLSRCNRIIRPCGDPIVIGSRRTQFGPLEIVAFTSAVGLCVDLDMFGGAAGGCPNDPPQSPIKVIATSLTASPNDLGYTQLEGTTTPEVRKIDARYRQGGRWYRAKAVIARIEGDLQTRLDQAQPFGVFAITARGRVDPHRFWLTARAADGSILETTRGPEGR